VWRVRPEQVKRGEIEAESSADLHISLGKIGTSLFDLCISGREIGISSGEIPILPREICKSAEDLYKWAGESRYFERRGRDGRASSSNLHLLLGEWLED